MLLVNIDYIPGKEFEVLGIVKGHRGSVQELWQRLHGWHETLVGGDYRLHWKCSTRPVRSRSSAWWIEAEALGADAIINIRYGLFCDAGRRRGLSPTALPRYTLS